MTLDKSHTLSGPLTFHIYQTLIRSSQDRWEKPSPPPPPRTRPLTWWTTPSISTGMMKSALFTGYGGKERLELRPGLPRRPSQARAGPSAPGLGAAGQAHLEGAVHQGLIQVDDHADLVRVLGLGLGEQILDRGLLWGRAGLAGGTSLTPPSFLHTSLPSCSRLAGKSQGHGERPPPSQICPCQLWSPGGPPGCLGLTSPPGKSRQRTASTQTGTFKFPRRSSRSCQVTSWVDQTFQGLQAGQEKPFPVTPGRASPGPCSPHLATTHLGNSSVLLHKQGGPAVAGQGLPIIPADAAEK